MVLDSEGRALVELRVLDWEESALRIFEVELVGEAGRFRVRSTPDEGFRIAGIPPGRYELTVWAPGFEMERQVLHLDPTEALELQVRLAPELQMARPPAAMRPEVEPGDAPLSPSPPVYNAVFSPVAEREPLILAPDEPVSLTFDIGEPREESALGGTMEVSDLIQAADQPTRLQVILSCFICTDDENQVAFITYDPDTRASDAAHFELIPRREPVEAAGGLGRVELSVLLDGVELEVIEIPLFVGAPTEAARAEYRAPSRREVATLPSELRDGPDLVLIVGPASGSDLLPVRLLPLDPVLLADLQEATGSSEPSFVFRSGVTDGDLEQLARSIYFRLSHIIHSGNDRLTTLYAGTPAGVVAVSSTGRFSPQDSAQVTGALAEEGELLYWRIFNDGAADPRLQRAMAAVEARGRERLAAGAPLRIRVHNTAPWAPWQLLSTTAEGSQGDPERFWGIRYEMGVRQTGAGREGPVATRLDWPSDHHLALATHREDRLVRRGAGQLNRHLASRAGSEALWQEGLSPFLDGLERAASELKFLLLFTHGRSEDPVVGGNGPTVWPQLLFASDEVLQPPDIERLGIRFAREAGPGGLPFLRARPVVFLSACESGTGGRTPTTNNNFVGAFLRNGASSVIATESAVWVGFAHDFARDVIDELFEGRSVGAAVQRARQRHLAERGNPMGLVYSVYGNPSARFMPPEQEGPQ